MMQQISGNKKRQLNDEEADTGTPTKPPKKRLAVIVSHPIQYYVPYYRAITAEGSVDLKAFYCSRIGLDTTFDPGMGVEMSWKTDLLSGYEHAFLPDAETIKAAGFRDINNPSVIEHLEKYQPDVVLLHGYAHMTLLRVLMWCRRKKIPVMSISDRSFSGESPLHRRIVRRLVVPKILKQFSAFLVIGDEIQQFFRSFGARSEAIFRVPNMLDKGFWDFSKRKKTVREITRAELGLKDELVVLYVGKFLPRKRPQDLLSALTLIMKDANIERPIKVIYAGDGQMRVELEERARKENLPAEFLGFVNIDDLPKYYCAADVLGHPAENESYGIIALEAAVFGLPLVLSDGVGAIGSTSIARPGENAIVHPSGDVVALAGALKKLANEPETYARMSEASTRFAKDHDGRISVENTLVAINYCLGLR